MKKVSGLINQNRGAISRICKVGSDKGEKGPKAYLYRLKTVRKITRYVNSDWERIWIKSTVIKVTQILKAKIVS